MQPLSPVKYANCDRCAPPPQVTPGGQLQEPVGPPRAKSRRTLARDTTLVGCRSVRRCPIRGPFSRIQPDPPVLVAFLSQGVSSSREVP
jgi:hypothetical protein